MATKHWLPVLLSAGIIAALIPPIINYVVDKPAAITPQALDGKAASFADASKVFASSCMACHSSTTVLPWYANMPIARDIIGDDMAQGRHALNMETTLLTPGTTPTMATLAQIEHVLNSDEMPPLRYTAMHWKAMVNGNEKAAMLQWIADERATKNAQLGVADDFLNEPVSPIPTNLLAVGVNNPNSTKAQQKIWLGNKLFHDTALSGDGTLSCASCHGLGSGGVDGGVSSTGIRGQVGPINAPTVFNAVFNSHQFWDGRAADLHEQALGPVTNPIEMGGHWDEILPKLAANPDYAKAFATLYGNNPAPSKPTGEASSANVTITKTMVADTIAAFEASLITPNSPFDQYLRGNTTALTNKQIRGYEVFKSIGCTQCHAGIALGGQGFKKMGQRSSYFAARGTQLTDVDQGRANVTKNALDTHYFKVPTLRNIALTGPYFHDGNTATLSNAVTTMATHQLGKTLSKADTAAIVAFLESLTGEYNGQQLTLEGSNHAEHSTVITPPQHTPTTHE